MAIACWAAKGGSGTTVVAAAYALHLGTSSRDGAVLVDLDGDLPACLGRLETDPPGITDLLGSIGTATPDALGNLLIEVAPRTWLLPRGNAPLHPDAAPYALQLLDRLPRPTVVDLGTRPDGARAEIARTADRSVLVVRACAMALRRCLDTPFRPSHVVVVDEPGRALRVADVEAVLGIPVSTVVPHDPAIARAVDAGLLATRVPRRLQRAVRDAA